MNNGIKTKELGQSIWYDNIDRKDLENGYLRRLIAQGIIYGVTSNPSIFEKSIGQGNAYDLNLQAMAWAGLSSEQIYFELVKQDIQNTADAFKQIFDSSEQTDGYVSVEIDPMLANNTAKSIQEGKALWAQINRKNLMIKVPATQAGIPVIRALTAEGVNVNATLIFSIDRYQEVVEAYLLGLEDRLKQGLSIDHIHSVASFFVSRIDTAVDNLLVTKKEEKSELAGTLTGKIAIDCARLVYQEFKKAFSSPRFENLAQKGAQIQRPLWASTGTKNAKYSDCLYVDELIGKNTVNTIPASTLSAYLEHGKPFATIENELKDAISRLDALIELGINLWDVARQLEDEGVLAFQNAHHRLLSAIETKRQRFAAELGPLKSELTDAIQTAVNENYVSRLFEKDPTLWTDDSGQFDEIRNRLGWLSLPGKQFGLIPEYEAFLQALLKDDFTDVFVLGMGGSSLAPEVLAQSFGNLIPNQHGLRLRIIDTTNPHEIQQQCDPVNLEHTLFIVASKSGSTSETLAAYHYFSDQMKHKVGDKFGNHFIAITDPGSSLSGVAQKDGFRFIFYAPSDVGGRFSVFTPFGLVPAALIGIDLETFLNKAAFSDLGSLPAKTEAANANLMLGLVLGKAAISGRNKLTFIAENFAANLVPWLEQLIAESSGKDGKGILPIEGEPELASFNYPDDRLFVTFEVDGSKSATIEKLIKLGYPVLRFHLNDPYDLAREFYRWEYATAIACAVIGVNAFNQPDVQSNKLVTKEVIKQYQETGKLEEGKPFFSDDEVRIFGNVSNEIEAADSMYGIISSLAKQIPFGGFIAINAFLPRNPENTERFQALRSRLLNDFNVATTLGFGPRFLHSTGQFHKGGTDGGLYLIFTEENQSDIEIPGENMGFGALQLAQALGDFEVLQIRGKKVIRIALISGD